MHGKSGGARTSASGLETTPVYNREGGAAGAGEVGNGRGGASAHGDGGDGGDRSFSFADDTPQTHQRTNNPPEQSGEYRSAWLDWQRRNGGGGEGARASAAGVSRAGLDFSTPAANRAGRRRGAGGAAAAGGGGGGGGLEEDSFDVMVGEGSFEMGM